MASGTDANPEVTLASLESARATLGIPSFASRDEARRAYRALARAFHPDKGGDVNRFREVRKAHERLEAAWNASAARHPRDGSAADTVASPEAKRDDGSLRSALGCLVLAALFGRQSGFCTHMLFITLNSKLNLLFALSEASNLTF